MNNALSSGHGTANPSPSGSNARYSRNADDIEDNGFRELLASIWEGRYWLLGSIGLFLFLGMVSIWRTTPIYQADAMLQLQDQGNGNSDPSSARVEKLFSEPVETQAEIEILKSNLVLGRVVESFKLDMVNQPVLIPVIGAALMRHNQNAPRLTIASFEIPDSLRGKLFQVKALKDGTFQWSAPDGSDLAAGRPGDQLIAAYSGETLKLKVLALTAKPGQKFKLGRKSMSKAIDSLRLAFDASEKGRMTKVLGLSFRATSPIESARVLNEIVSQYVHLKIERRGREAAKTLAVLQEKMPALKAKLDESENRLNQFRSNSGSVDLMREADIFLQQSSGLSAQITTLKQRREELLRTYTQDADIVVTVDQQLSKLQNEASRVEARVRTLPRTQQEVVRLSREVQVNTELYTALLNKIQDLQVATAGEIGNVSVVDPAMSSPDPIAPRKTMVMALFLFMGLISGTGLTMLRRALRRGVEDHRLIESKLGMPVLVTIPHSKAQEGHHDAIRKRTDGIHLLAMLNQDDLVTESLRSLRTLIQLSTKKASNRVIMVTGPAPSTGKSFISANLSVVLAQTGSRVLVVDGDLRRGNLHHYFGLKNRVGGLSEVLSGRAEWRSVIRPVTKDSTCEDSTEVTGLHMMSSGILPPNPSELLLTNRFSTFLTEASAVYDYVLIDSPPLLAVTDATIIGSKAGTVLLVAKYGQHPMDEFRTCQKRMDSHGIHLTGCVFNDVKPLRSGYKYAYHYSYK